MRTRRASSWWSVRAGTFGVAERERPTWSRWAPRYDGILGVAKDPLVSSDILGDPRAAVFGLELTRVVDGTLVKVMAWYDNECGFTHQMIREAERSWADRRAAGQSRFPNSARRGSG